MTPEQDRKECEKIARDIIVRLFKPYPDESKGFQFPLLKKEITEALLAERKKRREKISEEEWRHLVTTKTMLLENALEAERKRVREARAEIEQWKKNCFGYKRLLEEHDEHKKSNCMIVVKK